MCFDIRCAPLTPRSSICLSIVLPSSSSSSCFLTQCQRARSPSLRPMLPLRTIQDVLRLAKRKYYGCNIPSLPSCIVIHPAAYRPTCCHASTHRPPQTCFPLSSSSNQNSISISTYFDVDVFAYEPPSCCAPVPGSAALRQQLTSASHALPCCQTCFLTQYQRAQSLPVPSSHYR
jgi:hypothetical protein